MILGFLVIVGLLVTKFSDVFSGNLPDEITLPDGAKATAFTQGDDWYAVVTDDDKILIYNRSTGNLRKTITLETETE